MSLRDRLEALAAVETLWQATDILSNLSALVRELSRRGPLPEQRLEARCAEAIASGTALSATLDEMAFLQAQRLDYARQMGEGLAAALERLASADQPGRPRLSLTDLTALYVCEDQRETHALALRAFDQRQGGGSPKVSIQTAPANET
jgi:hypothetical protein